MPEGSIFPLFRKTKIKQAVLVPACVLSIFSTTVSPISVMAEDLSASRTTFGGITTIVDGLLQDISVAAMNVTAIHAVINFASTNVGSRLDSELLETHGRLVASKTTDEFIERGEPGSITVQTKRSSGHPAIRITKQRAITTARPSDDLALPITVDRIDIQSEVSSKPLPDSSFQLIREDRIVKQPMNCNIIAPLPAVQIGNKKDPFNGAIELMKPFVPQVRM